MPPKYHRDDLGGESLTSFRYRPPEPQCVETASHLQHFTYICTCHTQSNFRANRGQLVLAMTSRFDHCVAGKSWCHWREASGDRRSIHPTHLLIKRIYAQTLTHGLNEPFRSATASPSRELQPLEAVYRWKNENRDEIKTVNHKVRHPPCAGGSRA